ncbi:PH domain-containing protein [Oceanobacillus luteolus]|uniref:PH domain-containing protein n=1 Tax=Oceanobacillus luteolus TaxID=1274358 RepID=UPI00203D7DC8
MVLIYFGSIKDTIYFFAVWGTIAVVLFGTIIDGLYPAGILIGGTTLILLFWMWFGTGYVIQQETLIVKFGPFKKKINIEGIKRISKEKNVWAAPALAADRLRIHYGLYEEISISPKNKEEFVKLLLEKNKKIELDEELIEVH